MESNFSKVRETSTFYNSVEKNLARHDMFRKVAFLEISRVAGLQYSVCKASKNELPIKFLKCALKLTENFQVVISTEGSYQKFTDLQTSALRFFKAPKVASMVEFLSSEVGATGFSTE